MALSKPRLHKIKGEHLVDGVVFGYTILSEVLEKVKVFNMDGDIIIASYPKTGTTWVQEIVWQITHPDDQTEARETPLHLRIPYLEMKSPTLPRPYIEMLAETPHPRLIKTHLPVKYFENQLLSNLKVIVPMRNPKDTLVSYYHFYRMNLALGGFDGSWDDFLELYKAKHLLYGDYFDWLREAWKQSKNPNILFVKYEDMKTNLMKEISRIANFLKEDLPDDVIGRIASHCGFESMKDNTMTNYTAVPQNVLNHDISPFMRKGAVGDWKNYFSAEQSGMLDAEYTKLLNDTGFQFDFE